MRGEAGHDDPAAGLGDHVADDHADIALGRDEAADLGVGRVSEQEIDARIAEAGEAGQVGQSAVQRRLVHLEVAGVQDGVPSGADRDGEGIRDRVVHREELEGPVAELDVVLLLHQSQVGVLEASLLELGLEQRKREPRAEDGDVGALAQQVGQCADVVLVAVGEHHRIDLVQTIGVVGPVGQGDVDARGVRLAQQHAAVDDDDPPRLPLRRVLEEGHVATDFLDAAECDDPQATGRDRWG